MRLENIMETILSIVLSFTSKFSFYKNKPYKVYKHNCLSDLNQTNEKNSNNLKALHFKNYNKPPFK